VQPAAGIAGHQELVGGYPAQLRAQGQDDAKRRAQRCVEAVQEASLLAAGRGWLS